MPLSANFLRIMVLVLLCLWQPPGLQASPQKIKNLNKEKAAIAEAVLRVEVISTSGGSKYVWSEVLVHDTYKSPNGVEFPPRFKLAHLSFAQGLPLGKATLYLTRYNKDKPELGWKLLEQYNSENKKYSQGYSHHSKADLREVMIQVDGGKVLGTFTKAIGPQARKQRAVLFVSGSGPTDRDGNSIGAFGKNNCLKYLSTEILSSGISTLRIDKRGIGASKAALDKESDLRFSTYVDDITHCIEYLNRLGYDEIILLGHSEGALIATMAAKHPSVVSLVSLAGVGRPAADVLSAQLKQNLPQDLYKEASGVIGQLVRGKRVVKLPVILGTFFRPSVQPYLISWFEINPINEIAKLNIPTLIIQGSTDLQVSVKDAQLLDSASKLSKLIIIEGMNHVLKSVAGDLNQQRISYINPKLPLNPTLITEVLEFLKQEP